jgi:protein-tyrosine phosphatase
MRIYWIKDLEMGQIGMMPRPRGNDWLYDEIIALKNNGVDVVISLLEFHEMDELELIEEGSYCVENGIEYINHPVKDRSVPECKDAFHALVEELITKLENDKNIVIHCRMGIGRTSLLAAAILLKLKPWQTNIFEYLSEIRTLCVPDTREQKDWVLEAQR